MRRARTFRTDPPGSPSAAQRGLERRASRSLARRVGGTARDVRELALDHRNQREPQSDAHHLAGQRREEAAAEHVTDAGRRQHHPEGIALDAASQIDRAGKALRLVPDRLAKRARFLHHGTPMIHRALSFGIDVDGHCLLLYRDAILPSRYPRASAPARHTMGRSLMNSAAVFNAWSTASRPCSNI